MDHLLQTLITIIFLANPLYLQNITDNLIATEWGYISSNNKWTEIKNREFTLQENEKTQVAISDYPEKENHNINKTEAFNTKSGKTVDSVATKAVENSPVLVSCELSNDCITPTIIINKKLPVKPTPTPTIIPTVTPEPIPSVIITPIPTVILPPNPCHSPCPPYTENSSNITGVNIRSDCLDKVVLMPCID